MLYDRTGCRFVDELQPRDVVTAAIREQMKKDGTDFVWLSMEPLGEKTILEHFPNIRRRCLEEGYDVAKQWIPVVPAQHYFMGGIWVDSDSRTSMQRLFAVGETSCNGVHGSQSIWPATPCWKVLFSPSGRRKKSQEIEKDSSGAPERRRACRDGWTSDGE